MPTPLLLWPGSLQAASGEQVRFSGLRLRVWGLCFGFRVTVLGLGHICGDTNPIMENQTEKNQEHEIQTGLI